MILYSTHIFIKSIWCSCSPIRSLLRLRQFYETDKRQVLAIRYYVHNSQFIIPLCFCSNLNIDLQEKFFAIFWSNTINMKMWNCSVSSLNLVCYMTTVELILLSLKTNLAAAFRSWQWFAYEGGLHSIRCKFRHQEAYLLQPAQTVRSPRSRMLSRSQNSVCWISITVACKIKLKPTIFPWKPLQFKLLILWK